MRKKPDFKFERQAHKRGYKVVIGVDEVGRGALAGPVVAGAVAIQLSVFGRRFSDIGLSVSSLPVTERLKTGKREAENRKPRTDNWDFDWGSVGINDSKKLTAKKRGELDKLIRKYAWWGIGQVGVGYINRYGIVKATERAMRRAIANLVKKYEMKGKRDGIKERTIVYSPLSFPSSRTPYLLSGSKIFILLDAFHVKYIPGVGLKNQQAIIKGDEKVFSIAAASIIAKVHRDRLMAKVHKVHKIYKVYKWHKNKGYGTKEHLTAIRKFGVTKHHRRQFIHS